MEAVKCRRYAPRLVPVDGCWSSCFQETPERTHGAYNPECRRSVSETCASRTLKKCWAKFFQQTPQRTHGEKPDVNTERLRYVCIVTSQRPQLLDELQPRYPSPQAWSLKTFFTCPVPKVLCEEHVSWGWSFLQNTSHNKDDMQRSMAADLMDH